MAVKKRKGTKDIPLEKWTGWAVRDGKDAIQIRFQKAERNGADIGIRTFQIGLTTVGMKDSDIDTLISTINRLKTWQAYDFKTEAERDAAVEQFNKGEENNAD